MRRTRVPVAGNAGLPDDSRCRLLLGFQLTGELVVWALHLPVSGPICGKAALLV
jgi:hypothetical protein